MTLMEGDSWFCNTCKRLFELPNDPPAPRVLREGTLGLDACEHECQRCAETRDKYARRRAQIKQREGILLAMLRRQPW